MQVEARLDVVLIGFMELGAALRERSFFWKLVARSSRSCVAMTAWRALLSVDADLR